jgi:sec-independent protein translocase protein TatA
MNGKVSTDFLRDHQVSEVSGEKAMFGLGAGELVVVGVILFLLFGAKRLPEIGKGLGGAIREFKKVKKDLSLKGEADAPHPTSGSKQEKVSIPETTTEKDQLPGKNT